MKQLKEEIELVGKTILRVKSYENYTAIFFIDDTFCIFIGKAGYPECSDECYLLESDFKIDKNQDLDTLFQLSFIDKNQYEEYGKEEQERYTRERERIEKENLQRLLQKYPECKN